MSLKNVELQLPALQFLRVHRQFIINLQHIVSINADNTISLQGGHSVAIGTSYKNTLLEKINKNMLNRLGG